jgi:hypothetical protein
MLGIPSDAGGQYCLVDLKRLSGELCMFACLRHLSHLMTGDAQYKAQSVVTSAEVGLQHSS